MARTAITPTAFTPNASLADPAGTAGDATNGHSITGVELEEIVLRVVNGGAGGINVTVKAGANPPADHAGQGDLVEAIGAGATEFFGPFTSARFKQSDDGTDPEGLWVDLDVDTSVTITAFHMPRTA